MPADPPRPERDEVVLHPNTVLALCEAESAKWWAECDVRSFVEAVRRDPTPERMEAFARQCFEEGAYRGAVNAAEGGRARLAQAERRAEEAERRLQVASAALTDAADDVASWGAYAGDYFQEKHDLSGNVAQIRAAALAADAQGGRGDG